MTLARNCLLAVLTCSIAACTVLPPLGPDPASADRPAASCSDISKMRFAKLAYPSETPFSIGGDSPAFDFPGLGISRFEAFELPKVNGSYRLQLRSFFGLLLLGELYPVITFLDEHKQVIGMTDPLRLAPGFPTLFEGAGLDIDIEITPADGARYAIVHTTPDLVKSGPMGAVTTAKVVAAKGGFAVQGSIHPRGGNGYSIGDLKLVIPLPPKFAPPLPPRS